MIQELDINFESTIYLKKDQLVRTEIRVETMQNEIKKTEENVLNTLLEIKKTALDIYDRFEDFKNNMTGEINTQMNDLQKEEGIYVVLNTV